MKRVVFYGLVTVVALAILLFMMSYTVRFTESAVVTTFGSAGENAVETDPGLKFKWPYPVQSVTVYDSRLRVLRTRSETQQTADDRQIVIEAFCFWRVSDALAFFKAYSNAGDRPVDQYAKAEDILTDALRSAVSESSNYRLQELFTRDPGASRLADLEGRILEALNSSGGGEEGAEQGIAATGIEITTVGISRVVLPEQTTQQVINRMKAGRERLAEEIRTEGESRATAIEAAADRDASLIESFALARAASIRAEGIRESARFLEVQNESPELAVFLETLEFMKRDIGKKATLIQSVSDFGFQPFSATFLQDLDENGLPRLRSPGSLMEGRRFDSDARGGAGVRGGAELGAGTGARP